MTRSPAAESPLERAARLELEAACARAAVEAHEARRRRRFPNGPCIDCGQECSFGGCPVADWEPEEDE